MDLVNELLRHSSMSLVSDLITTAKYKGRVRVMSEEYHVDQSGINITPISSVDIVIATTKSILPKIMVNRLKSMMGGDLLWMPRLKQHHCLQKSCRRMWFHQILTGSLKTFMV